MAIERELLLIKVKADANHRLEIMRLSEVFNARVVDAGADSLLLECVEHPDRLAALEQLLSPYTIIEAVRTGRVAMTRASVAHDESRAPLRILG
jgi:acetolactate synthase-1/3 small subunit